MIGRLPRPIRLDIALALGIVTLDVAILLGNRFFFDQAVVITGDYAASSIGAFEAASFGRVYGTPSWNGYYHPGAFLMYYQSIFEAVATLMGYARWHIAIAFASHLLLVNLAILGIVACFRQVFPKGHEMGPATVAVTTVFLAAKPLYLVSLWEPFVGAVIFLTFLSAATCASFGRFRYLVIAVVLGGLCVQIQLTFLLPVAGTLIASLVLYFVSRPRPLHVVRAKEAGGLVAASIIGFWPTLADIVLFGGQNLSYFMDYARATAHLPKLTIVRSIELVGENLQVPRDALVLVTVLLLTSTTLFFATRTSSGHGYHSVHKALKTLGRPALLASLGPILAVLFYRYLANASYAPSHASYYVYVSLSVMVATLAVFPCLLLRDRLRHVCWMVAVLTLPVFTLYTLAKHDGYSHFSHGQDPGTVFVSEGFTELLESIQTASDKGYPKLRVVVDFAPPDKAVSLERREFPWRLAIGLSDTLRRRGIPYTFGVTAPENNQYPLRIITMFGSARAASAGERSTDVLFTCEGGNAVARFEGRAFVLAKCPERFEE